MCVVVYHYQKLHHSQTNLLRTPFLCTPFLWFITIRNYITLKLLCRRYLNIDGFITIRNYITLKLPIL